ncbi:MAG: hypothetical protein ACLTS6_06530 [Anaerobutyricum sp.]
MKWQRRSYDIYLDGHIRDYFHYQKKLKQIEYTYGCFKTTIR